MGNILSEILKSTSKKDFYSFERIISIFVCLVFIGIITIIMLVIWVICMIANWLYHLIDIQNFNNLFC